MATLTTQPSNPNFLSPLHFRFSIQRLPNVVFFLTGANVPDVTLPTATQLSPLQNIPRPANKMDWGDFDITFKVDEDMQNYLELFNWLVDIGSPDNQVGYANLIAQQNQGYGVFSDATLTILDSMKNPNVEVKYINMFPGKLSELRFDQTADDIDYVECTCTFTYQRFYVTKL